MIDADTHSAGGATSVNGELVDRPQVERARLIMRRLGGSAHTTPLAAEPVGGEPARAEVEA